VKRSKSVNAQVLKQGEKEETMSVAKLAKKIKLGGKEATDDEKKW